MQSTEHDDDVIGLPSARSLDDRIAKMRRSLQTLRRVRWALNKHTGQPRPGQVVQSHYVRAEGPMLPGTPHALISCPAPLNAWDMSRLQEAFVNRDADALMDLIDEFGATVSIHNDGGAK